MVFSINQAIVERLREGLFPWLRPSLPAEDNGSFPQGLRMMMKRCWAEEPLDRPAFDEIHKLIRHLNNGKYVAYYNEVLLKF